MTLAAVCLASGVLLAQEPMPAGPHDASRDRFVGLWRYVAEDSRNMATGRPERGARGAAPPRAIVSPRAPERPADAPEAADRTSPFAPSPYALREARELTRDLLEIAETLEFAITDDAVTITDDLERARTYPVDNRRQRYRLGASEFFARVRWDDDRLRREIEGSFGFRMTETYYLSADASRLFLIIRVGSPARGRPPVGVDRVYERLTIEDP